MLLPSVWEFVCYATNKEIDYLMAWVHTMLYHPIKSLGGKNSDVTAIDDFLEAMWPRFGKSRGWYTI